MTAMWGGVITLYVVFQVLMSLCVLFVYVERFEAERSKEQEATGQLVQIIGELGRSLEENTEKVHNRVLAHAERIRELQTWIDHFEEELEEIKYELGIEHESEPQS